MKKILLSLSFLTAAFGSAQISLNEGFEAGTTPSGFTNVSFFPSKVLAPCTGSYGLTRGFWSGGVSGNTTYASSLSNGGKLDISFGYKTHIYNGGSVNGSLKVEYSADGGQNFITLSTINLTTVISCTTWSGTIPQGAVPNGAGFRFRVSGQYISGEYDVILDDFKISQSPFLATSEIGKKSALVYPNPFKDVIYLENPDEIDSVSISDFSGRKIKNFNNSFKELQLKDLVEGVYILTVNYKDAKSKTMKIVKK